MGTALGRGNLGTVFLQDQWTSMGEKIAIVGETNWFVHGHINERYSPYGDVVALALVPDESLFICNIITTWLYPE
jgi:hypothetical protein